MKIPSSHFFNVFIICLITLFWIPLSNAELYKWIDGKGQTHYSDKKQSAGKVVIKELKLKDSYNGGPITPMYKSRSVENEVEKTPESNKRVPQPHNISSNWGGDQLETDATRCALAREILDGTVAHGNGAITDDYDKKVANRDVTKFCH